jgi:5-methylcytosine-specific restriction endonuclease McrA
MFLFNRQKGRCHFCRQRITDENVKESQLHRHHMKPRSEGGTHKSGNLRLIHNECHTKLHGIISRKEMARFMNNGIDYLRLTKLANNELKLKEKKEGIF